MLWSRGLSCCVLHFATGHAHFQFSTFQRSAFPKVFTRPPQCPPLVPFVNPCARCGSAKVSTRPWTLFLLRRASAFLPSPFFHLLSTLFIGTTSIRPGTHRGTDSESPNRFSSCTFLRLGRVGRIKTIHPTAFTWLLAMAARLFQMDVTVTL